MVVKASQERVSTLLKDTITLLCKNGLEFQNKFSVEALIGVTLDDNEVFLISMNELVKSDNVIEDVEGQAPDTTSGRSTHRSPEHKRKRRHRETEGGSGDTGLDPMVKVKSEPTAHEPPGGGSQDSDRVINPKTEQLWGEEGPPSLSLSAVDDSSSQSYPANPDEPTAKSQRTENLDDDDDDDDDGDDLVFVKQEGSEMPRSSCAMSQSFPGRSPSSQQFSPGAYSSQPNFGDMSLQSLTSRESSAIWSQTSPGMSSPQSFASPVRGGRQRISTVTSGSLDPSLEQQPGHRIPSQLIDQGCSFCGKQFSTRHGLKLHEDKHKGLFPYHCHICGKGFLGTTHLKGHVAIHTGIREFTCDYCGMSFTYKRVLTRHVAQCMHKTH